MKKQNPKPHFLLIALQLIAHLFEKKKFTHNQNKYRYKQRIAKMKPKGAYHTVFFAEIEPIDGKLGHVRQIKKSRGERRPPLLCLLTMPYRIHSEIQMKSFFHPSCPNARSVCIFFS
jgi:hypothetical protein